MHTKADQPVLRQVLGSPNIEHISVRNIRIGIRVSCRFQPTRPARHSARFLADQGRRQSATNNHEGTGKADEFQIIVGAQRDRRTNKPNPNMTPMKVANDMIKSWRYRFHDNANPHITCFYCIIITKKQVNRNSYLLAQK